MTSICNKLVEKAGGEGGGGLGGYSKSVGTGMDDGTGFIFYVNNFFPRKFPSRFQHLGFTTSKIPSSN